MSSEPPATDPPIPPDLPEDPEVSYEPGVGKWEAWASMETEAPEDEKTRGLLDRAGRAARKPRRRKPAARPSPQGSGGKSTRFILHRKIAEGGFGEIWEATQLALGRTIAIKRLKPRQGEPEREAGPASAQEATRALDFDFRQEALTAAHLEHPNIIPVYDLGRDDSGRPLLAMKLVQGRLWSDVLRDEFPAMPPEDFLFKHLQILISVAQAVAYAHAHGIIHRDLKPAQVMIGQYGEALLMDWGLAMAWKPSETATTLPSLLRDPNSPLLNPITPAGTPAYMAPEQTENTPDNLGPWTDVYLLGGILYRLLTGRNPHTGNKSATTFVLARMGMVERPEIRVPGREVPRQLALLAMKAMEKEPRDRVGSVEEFVKALQDYLTGADKRRESTRLSAEVSRRLAEAGTQNDYGLLVECLNQLDQSLILWPGNPEALDQRQETLARYARAARDNRDLKLARVQAERLDPGIERDALVHVIGELEEVQRRQDERLAEALRQAEIERDRAREARARADSMRDRAETLVRFLLGDLHPALKSIGRLDLMRRASQQSLQYFDSLSEAEATLDTLYNRAVAYMNIGDVWADEGRKPEARDAYQKARELAQRLVAHDSERQDWQVALADAYDRCGLILYYQGRPAEALDEHAAALEIRERLARIAPSVASIEAGIASCYHKMGIIHWRQQELDRARELHLAALGRFRRLAAGNPDDRDLLASVGWCLSTFGNVYRDLGDVDRSVEVTREALDIRESLMNQEPADASRIDDFLWTQGNLALLLMHEGELEKSLDLFRKYLPLRRRLFQEDPDNVVRITAVTFTQSLMGEILYALGRLEESETTLRECLTITSELYARDPTSTHVVSACARLYGQLGENLLAQGRRDEARPLLDTSVALGRKALTVASQNVMALKALVTSLTALGRLQREEGDRERAREAWQEARALLAHIKISGDEVDVLDLSAQLTLLLGTGEDVTPWLMKLKERRWVTPSLRSACARAGISLNS